MNITTSEPKDKLWHATVELRWSDGWSKEPRLQQRWISETGRTEWRDIPKAEPPNLETEDD